MSDALVGEAKQDVKAILEDYLRLKDSMQELVSRCENELHAQLPKPFTVSGRIKSIHSLAAKLTARSDAKRLEDLRDVIGIRLVAPTIGELPQLCSLVERHFGTAIRSHETRAARQGLRETEFGYDSIHYVADQQIGDRKLPVEIQVRTALSDTWSNVSHDTLYKSEYRKTAMKESLAATDAPLGASQEMGRLKAALEMIDEHYDRFINKMVRMDDHLGPFLTKKEADQEAAPFQAILAISELSENEKRRTRLNFAKSLRRTGQLDEGWKILPETFDTPEEKLERAFLLMASEYAAHPNGVGFDQGVLNQVARLARECAGTFPGTDGDWEEWSQKESREKRRRFVQARMMEAEAKLVTWDRNRTSALDSEEFLDLIRGTSSLAPRDPMALALLVASSLANGAEPHRLATDLQASLDAGISRCRELVGQGLETVRASFAHGRLALLREPIDSTSYEAFRAYCRGIAYCLHPEAAVNALSELGRERTALRKIEEANPQKGYGDRVAECRALFDIALLTLQAPPSDATALIVAGTTDETQDTWLSQRELWTDLLRAALQGFTGRIIGGGTTHGVCGCVLKATLETGKTAVGYSKERLAAGWAASGSMGSELPHTLLGTALRYWQDLLQPVDGWPVNPRNVTLFGFGGGPVSACEYRLAAALGARVALFEPAEREGTKLLTDPSWRFMRTIIPLIPDVDVAWYLGQRHRATNEGEIWNEDIEARVAIGLHNAFVGAKDRLHVQPDVLAKWNDLPKGYQDSNVGQARALRLMLGRAGFEIVKPPSREWLHLDVSAFAPMEHARWCVDKLLDGYRYGPQRDNDKKIHPSLVAWQEMPGLGEKSERHREYAGLPEVEREKDRHFVAVWRSLLDEVGLGLRRSA